MLDGVYTLDSGEPRFVPLDPPTTEDVEDLVERIADAALTWLAKQGIDDDDLPDDPDDAHLLVQAASMAGRTALGRRRVRRVQTFRGREVRLPPRCAACEGFTLHGGTAVGRWDREGLERLCRYVARPPLASDRLAVRRDGRVHLTLKTPWHDGTTALVFSRADFVARLAALVPPPRAHTVLYHGVLAPRAALRSRVVPTPPPPPAEASLRLTLVPAPVPARWRTWAELLARVFALGFTLFWARSRRGWWALKVKTAKSRLTRALHAIKDWMAQPRHRPIEEQAEALARKLRGHYQYYGVPGNSSSITRFLHEVRRRWRRALGRRSQRYLTWARFEKIVRRHPLPPARLPTWRHRQLRLAKV